MGLDDYRKIKYENTQLRDQNAVLQEENQQLKQLKERIEEITKNQITITIHKCKCGHWEFEHPLFSIDIDHKSVRHCSNCNCNNFDSQSILQDSKGEKKDG